jgi:CheY-like chemotaxis protein
VLVIDDDAPVRRLLADFMAVLGYQVEAAADGIEGLSRFEQAPHDLVVTDVRMPGVNGWDVVRGVRRLRRDVGIIVVSGIETELAQAAPDVAGLPGLVFLAKPVGLDDIRKAAERALAARPR